MVVAVLALFLAGGAGYAATGGSFILGQANTATSPSSLTASINDRALKLTNMNTGTGASALGLNVAPGHAPFLVGSSSGKVLNLNADKLDGLDSSNFTQGAASRTMFAKRSVAENATVVLLNAGWVQLEASCRAPDSPVQLLFLVRSTDPTRRIDVAIAGLQDYHHGVDSLITSSFDTSGGWDTIQVGQSYRLTDGGFPRTRMVTFVISGRLGQVGNPCSVQAQALAQG